MSDVTRILSAIEHGDPHAAEQLLPLVYDELRKLAAQRLAQEAPGQTLQATALVHEAYLRLVGGGHQQDWNGRGHFFAAAAHALPPLLRAARGARAPRPRAPAPAQPTPPPGGGPPAAAAPRRPPGPRRPARGARPARAARSARPPRGRFAAPGTARQTALLRRLHPATG